MTNVEHEFDQLNRWASLSDDQLANVATDEAVAALRRAAELLVDPAGPPFDIGKGNFGVKVRELRELYRRGSRGLGEAILEATAFQERGEIERAKDVYKEFLSSCPSQFYRKIARYQLEKLGGADV